MFLTSVPYQLSDHMVYGVRWRGLRYQSAILVEIFSPLGKLEFYMSGDLGRESPL